MLVVDDIIVGYGYAEVLHGVSIDVREGEIIAVVGANGAGKSTLLKAITGLLAPRRGAVTFLGERIDNIKAEDIVLKGIAHIPEGRRVFPHSTIEENLRAGAYTRTDREGIAADLDHFYRRFPALYERRDRLASTLSGGEQQMLAISRGLMSRPRLILMDEPSLGLSPLMVGLMFDIIEELNEEGKSILLVEQNATRALTIAHRGYVLVTGEIAFEGAGHDLLDSDEVQRSYLGG